MISAEKEADDMSNLKNNEGGDMKLEKEKKPISNEAKMRDDKNNGLKKGVLGIMTNWWAISPYRSTEKGRPDWAKPYHINTDDLDKDIFKKAWCYDLSNGTIAIGWQELGNTSRPMSKDGFKQIFKKVFPNSGNVKYAVWYLYNEVSKGDIIVARHGVNKMIGIGTVTGRAFYDEKKGKKRVGDPKDGTDDIYPNFIPVEWKKIKEIDFSRPFDPHYQFFSMGTFYKLKDDKIQEINSRI